MKLKETGIAVSEADVTAFESRRGIRLPPDYRKFLQQSNGGGVDGVFWFDISAAEGEASLALFFRLKDSSRSTRTLDYMNDMLKPRLPATVLAIGADGSGGNLCIGVSGPESGKVFYWDPGMDLDGTADGSFENFHELATSFPEFIEKVREPDLEA